ncbi:MAG TPA: hypothetical protein VKZ49_03705, partial [Polyangiaceae bacterium]|nr:hypothetical protein [Polyangiaceae bacterium]
ATGGSGGSGGTVGSGGSGVAGGTPDAEEGLVVLGGGICAHRAPARGTSAPLALLLSAIALTGLARRRRRESGRAA